MSPVIGGKKAGSTSKSSGGGGAGGGAAVSFHPDHLVEGGLANDFSGVIEEVRFVPFLYPGGDKLVLAARVTFQPDEDEPYQRFVQMYSCGDIKSFLPSQDGKNPVDIESDDPEDMAGPFVVRVGKRGELSSASNWAMFIKAAIEAGFPAENVSVDARVFEGIHGHFLRMDPPARPGLDKQKPVLVLVELLEPVAGTKKKAAAAATSATPAAAPKRGPGRPPKPKPAPEPVEEEVEETESENEGEGENGGEVDLDDRLANMIVTALNASDTGQVETKRLVGLVIAEFKGEAKEVKGAATARVTSPEFLSNRDEFGYDPDAKIVAQL